MKNIFIYTILCMLATINISCSTEFTEEKSSDIDSWPSSPTYVFTHPCMLHTDADFEYVRQKAMVETKQPWLMGYEKLKTSKRAQKTYLPVNPIKERDYKQTGKDEVYAFKNKLEKNGINVTIRREMGRDIDGACGQLRNKYMEDVDESNGDY